MQQKAIYQVCLAIGISLMSFTCAKTTIDYNVLGEFQYKNNMNKPITLKIINGYHAAFAQHIIQPNDVLILKTSENSHNKQANPLYFKPGASGDTTTVFFNDTLCYSEYHYNGLLLQNINTYTYEKRGDRDYIFRFNIDSTLFNLAVTCK
jgi:hypothetical protein